MGSKPKREKPVPPPPPPIPPPAPVATNDMVQEEYMKDKKEKRKGRRSTILSRDGYGFKLSDQDSSLLGMPNKYK